MAEQEEIIPSVLLPCNSCGRTFRPDALSKHAKYCEKSLIKKRKVFDSAKQRIQGTDLAEFLPVVTQKKKCDKSPIRKTQSKWKEKHMEFVRAIRAAKGGPSSDSSLPAAPLKPVDHEKCLYCDRYFGPKAYDRHLEWCKEHHSNRNRPKSPASIQARERLEARTKYKAPMLNRTRRASISEKCSTKSCTRDPSPAERLTRTRSSSLSSRTISSISREAPSNVSPKNNTALDSFKRNQPTRNSRRSVSPMKKAASDITKNKAVTNNVNQNNRSRGRQVSQQVLKSEAKKETNTTPKMVKGDIFSASCNISTINPGHNQKHKIRTPAHNSMENYDPYKSAERQMKELLGLSDDDDALVHSLVPQPPPVLNSLNSAFAKFSPIQSKKDPDYNFNRSPDSDLDNDFERLEAEAESRITPTLADRGGIVDKNFNPMSLSTISLCSTISIESFDNSRNSLRKGISSSAKVQSCDRKAQLPLQRSVSVVETPRRGRDFLKSNLKMEHLLFGVTGNNYNFNDNSLGCDVRDSSSDNKNLKSSNELLKNSNSSLASQAEQDLLKSVSEFEKLFATPSSLNPYSPLIPNSSPATTLTPLDHIDKHRSQANKFITDSAYNSLNRKSPQQESPVDVDNCSTGSSECSSTRGKAAQSANFCHECGAKFPVLAAKFCCNCGVRRLVI